VRVKDIKDNIVVGLEILLEMSISFIMLSQVRRVAENDGFVL
jgi:hypothetical protein